MWTRTKVLSRRCSWFPESQKTCCDAKSVALIGRFPGRKQMVLYGPDRDHHRPSTVRARWRFPSYSDANLPWSSNISSSPGSIQSTVPMQSTRSTMAKPRAPPLSGDPFNIHEDHGRQSKTTGFDNVRTEANDVEQPDYEDSSDDSDNSIGSVQDSVAEDMQKLEATFKGISKRFRLINRIGEGTRDPIWSGTFVAENFMLTVNH